MNFNQKLAAVFSLIAIVCQFEAQADDAQLRNLESRVSALEARRNPCMVNPPARPTQKCDFGGYISIDPLLLKAQENGLEFATVTQNGGQLTATTNSNFLAGRTKAKNLHFEWDWGFRLTLGANLEHDGWEAYLTWTRFWTDAHRHVAANSAQFLTPTFLNDEVGAAATFTGPAAQTQGLLTASQSNWKLHYNALNLEGAREFFVSKWLVFKPHGGLTTAWIRQKDALSYTGFEPPVVGGGTNPNPVTSASVRMKNNFWGIGLRFGLETQWGIACGWSLFGDASASLMYGYFNINHTESDVLVSGLVNNPLYRFNNFYHVERFITDFMAGVRYDYMFCCERYHLGFQLAWEHHMFFGQNQFPKFPASQFPGLFVANQGDLSLQGFSMQVRFDF
ncbi:MAG TPA: Lpg1974 family pore-forming outer membrane protein [Rhabdochlamydiaceae bacterium]|nr:Lpg1974 family pore-forming outer membrane protein [Rhabdochlamydiaceae bacterium]